MTGNELKERREQLGLTQEQLAKQLDRSSSTIARWEQGKTKKLPLGKLIYFAMENLIFLHRQKGKTL